MNREDLKSWMKSMGVVSPVEWEKNLACSKFCSRIPAWFSFCLLARFTSLGSQTFSFPILTWYEIPCCMCVYSVCVDQGGGLHTKSGIHFFFFVWFFFKEKPGGARPNQPVEQKRLEILTNILNGVSSELHLGSFVTLKMVIVSICWLESSPGVPVSVSPRVDKSANQATFTV